MSGAQAGLLADIGFALEAANPGGFPDPWDAPTLEATLASADEFAAESLAPFRAEADRIGCTLDNGAVRVPASFERAFADYVGRGLHLLGLPETHGGLGAPAGVQLAVTELLAAGDHSFQLLVGLAPGAAKLIAAYAAPDRAAELIGPMAAGETLATMAMTEPDAGSDLAAIRTTARPDGDHWRVTGDKIFISGGRQSMSGSILHMVLARTATRDDGRAEFSLFAVPDGDRVNVLRLEEKLGLHASPTCALSFAEAPGELIGERGGGLSAMFTMMNHARMDVAIQALAHAAAAGRLASDYAAERVQGRDASGQPAAIAEHGDVARMLDEIDATTLGLRAMSHLAVAPAHADLIDFTTPVCKAFVTDRGVAAIDTAMQVMGGYGYLGEYGIEQHWRDARITRVYEGTNGIMAHTLAHRLLGADNGALADRFAETATTFAGGGAASALHRTVETWTEARRTIEAARDRDRGAYAFLTLTGLVWYLAGWAALAAHADRSTDPGRMRRLARFAAAETAAEAAYLRQRVEDLCAG